MPESTPMESTEGSCPNLVIVKLKTRTWANEIEWSFVGTDCASDRDYENSMWYTHECCLPEGSYTVECHDSYGDGWHGGYLQINGNEKVCDNFHSGNLQTEAVTIETATTMAPESDSCMMTVTMDTQSWGNEVTWNIEGTNCNSDALAPYSSHEMYDHECCLHEGEYTLNCVDSWGDGWHGGSIMIDGISYCGDFIQGHSQTETIVIGSPMAPQAMVAAKFPHSTHVYTAAGLLAVALALVLYKFYPDRGDKYEFNAHLLEDPEIVLED